MTLNNVYVGIYEQYFGWSVKQNINIVNVKYQKSVGNIILGIIVLVPKIQFI